LQHVRRKRFGQHFLVDRHYIRRIVEAIDPRSDDLMVEIGPGLGALTRPLLERVRHLTAVEIDRDLVAALRREFAPERLTLWEQDALAFDFAALGQGLRVVGNLPYNISSPLLFRLAAVRAMLRDLHLTLQKEVVDRMTAAPDTPAYGRLSVMLQYRFAVEPLFDVPPGAFRPAPRVESTVARLRPLHPVTVVADESIFAEVVSRAFRQRRKTLRNALKGVVSPDVLETLGIDPGARGEVLSIAAFVAIANATAAAGFRPSFSE
jgi:16S rRNA (adenine1518-N6/adenine1519-N6)-dimethyltransferase